MDSRSFFIFLVYLLLLRHVWADTIPVTDFGAVGDGSTLNTEAFNKAIESFKGTNLGGTLYIPPGKWLTGCFNLTSHMTLFLEAGAEILGSQDLTQCPLIDPLPSYGRGREKPGRRYSSLLHGEGLTNLTITGNNGTINGQGSVWWEAFHKNSLKYSRGSLVEIINTNGLRVSNVTLVNSPMWTLHPVYCRDVVIQDVTILAPHDAPNTDGINPDSSSDVYIHNCYISNGDDAVAIKSGWDEYGISYGRPSTNISIHMVTAVGSHGISFGSEMSGGIANVTVSDVLVQDSEKQAIHIKTAVGRGGYIENIKISNLTIRDVKTAFAFSGLYKGHPDSKYDKNAYPRVSNVSIANVDGEGVSKAAKIAGLEQLPFDGICLQNVKLDKEARWTCSYIRGSSEDVYPAPCKELQSESVSACPSFM